MSNKATIFRYTVDDVTDDVRLLLNGTEVPYSTSITDLLHGKYLMMSNSYGSVNVFYLQNGQYNYSAGDTLMIDYIARNVHSNVRELESCLNTMINYSELLQKPLTIDVAKKKLSDSLNQIYDSNVTIDDIQKVVASHYNISLSDIKSEKRNKKFVFPRQIAVYISRKLTEYSFPEIGNEFGGRDHTTIMHSYEKIEDLLKTDSSLNSTIELLIRESKEYKRI